MEDLGTLMNLKLHKLILIYIFFKNCQSLISTYLIKHYIYIL